MAKESDAGSVDIVETILEDQQRQAENLRFFLPEDAKNIDLVSDIPPAMVMPFNRALLLASEIKSVRLRAFLFQWLRLRISTGRHSRKEWQRIKTAEADRARYNYNEGGGAGNGGRIM